MSHIPEPPCDSEATSMNGKSLASASPPKSVAGPLPRSTNLAPLFEKNSVPQAYLQVRPGTNRRPVMPPTKLPTTSRPPPRGITTNSVSIACDRPPLLSPSSWAMHKQPSFSRRLSGLVPNPYFTSQRQPLPLKPVFKRLPNASQPLLDGYSTFPPTSTAYYMADSDKAVHFVSPGRPKPTYQFYPAKPVVRAGPYSSSRPSAPPTSIRRYDTLQPGRPFNANQVGGGMRNLTHPTSRFPALEVGNIVPTVGAQPPRVNFDLATQERPVSRRLWWQNVMQAASGRVR